MWKILCQDLYIATSKLHAECYRVKQWTYYKSSWWAGTFIVRNATAEESMPPAGPCPLLTLQTGLFPASLGLDWDHVMECLSLSFRGSLSLPLGFKGSPLRYCHFSNDAAWVPEVQESFKEEPMLLDPRWTLKWCSSELLFLEISGPMLGHPVFDLVNPIEV